MNHKSTHQAIFVYSSADACYAPSPAPRCSRGQESMQQLMQSRKFTFKWTRLFSFHRTMTSKVPPNGPLTYTLRPSLLYLSLVIPPLMSHCTLRISSPIAPFTLCLVTPPSHSAPVPPFPRHAAPPLPLRATKRNPHSARPDRSPRINLTRQVPVSKRCVTCPVL